MFNMRERSRRDSPGSASTAATQGIGVGKSTLTEQLTMPPVQRKVGGSSVAHWMSEPGTIQANAGPGAPADDRGGQAASVGPGQAMPAMRTPPRLALFGGVETPGRGGISHATTGHDAQAAAPGERMLTEQLGGAGAPPVTANQTGAGDSGGLPIDLRSRMERLFGASFGGVRVHPNSGDPASRGVDAYAKGDDLHFAPGSYDPHSQDGQELIGHELAHVIQQRQGRVPSQPGGSAAAQPAGARGGQADTGLLVDAALEHEAESIGQRVARGETVATGDGTAQGTAIQGGRKGRRKKGKRFPAPGIDKRARHRNMNKSTWGKVPPIGGLGKQPLPKTSPQDDLAQSIDVEEQGLSLTSLQNEEDQGEGEHVDFHDQQDDEDRSSKVPKESKKRRQVRTTHDDEQFEEDEERNRSKFRKLVRGGRTNDDERDDVEEIHESKDPQGEPFGIEDDDELHSNTGHWTTQDDVEEDEVEPPPVKIERKVERKSKTERKTKSTTGGGVDLRRQRKLDRCRYQRHRCDRRAVAWQPVGRSRSEQAGRDQPPPDPRDAAARGDGAGNADAQVHRSGEHHRPRSQSSGDVDDPGRDRPEARAVDHDGGAPVRASGRGA